MPQEFYARVLGHDDKRGDPENHAVLLEVCAALAAYSEAAEDVRTRAEQILFDALSLEKGTGLLGVLRKPHLKHSERVELAICDALAKVGGPDSILPLRKLEATQAGLLSERAATAADAMLRRTEMPTAAE